MLWLSFQTLVGKEGYMHNNEHHILKINWMV